MSEEENISSNLTEEPINKYDNIFEPKFGIFKTLDYDLNLDERKVKFREYDSYVKIVIKKLRCLDLYFIIAIIRKQILMNEIG